MKNTALPRAWFVVLLCAIAGAGCFNPFRWPPKFISERTTEVRLHDPWSPPEKTDKPPASPESK
jgi:hypothetical protein